MRAVQLDGIEADAHRARCGGDEGPAHPLDIRRGHLPRHGPARTERQRRRRDGLPGVLARLQRRAAVPRQLRRGLAAGMGELDAEFRGAVAPAGVDDVLERRLAIIGIKSEAAVSDAPVALHMGRLHDEQAGAGIGEHAEMGHVPVVRAAVIGAVLAHRRDDDAIVEFDAGKFDGREQRGGHEKSLGGQVSGNRMKSRGDGRQERRHNTWVAIVLRATLSPCSDFEPRARSVHAVKRWLGPLWRRSRSHAAVRRASRPLRARSWPFRPAARSMCSPPLRSRQTGSLVRHVRRCRCQWPYLSARLGRVDDAIERTHAARSTTTTIPCGMVGCSRAAKIIPSPRRNSRWI